MKRLRRTLARLILMALLAACGGGAPITANAQESNLLVATTGTVRLQRYGWKEYVPIAAGARLYANDLLEVQGSATVLCTGLVVETINTSGKPPCPEERGSFVYDGARFGSNQRGTPEEIPYIIYPRKTLVLDPRPMLIWHATGAAHYDITIVDSSGNKVWNQAQITGNSIRYPDSAQVLQPGIDYLLTVKDANDKTSEADPAKGLGFRVLSAAKRPEVEQQQQAIMALEKLDPTARELALAVYYATWPGEDGRGLWGEAALLLEQVAQTQDTAEIQLWMGDMFRAVSLPGWAVLAYQKALQHAEASGNLACQAAAQGDIWRVTGEKARLEAALKIYRDLGEQQEANALLKTSTP